MSLSRRHFVQLASLSLVAGAVVPAGFAQEESEAPDDTFSPENLSIFDGVSRQTFDPYIEDHFTISLAGKRLGRLTLVSATDAHPGTAAVTAGGPAQPMTGFSLLFRATGRRLDQETYTLEQGALGKFPVLIVPGDPAVTPHTYEAIFTKLG